MEMSERSRLLEGIKPMKDIITIVVLNYNNAQDTLECVHSLKQNLPSDAMVEIVIVDNASTDDSYNEISQDLSGEVTLIRAKENAGYAAGNNIGIRYALKKGDGYICILNNDTIIDSDFLSPCIKALKKDRKVAFVSPSIIDYSSGKLQQTGMDIRLFRAKSIPLNRNMFPDECIGRHIRCDMVGGCCMIFHTTLVRKIGLIPEYYFMYFEETDWCWRAKKKNYDCMCVTDARIIHKGQSTVKEYHTLAFYLFERNRIVFAKHCMGRLQFLIFLGFDLVKSIYRGILDKQHLLKYVKWHMDGLLNRVDDTYFTIPGAVWRNHQ